ncbi:hypothetical protein TU80_28165 [Pseudomonas veronii]|nr:hypothetical protein TU80_28165 [Pseudomonas veronii]
MFESFQRCTLSIAQRRNGVLKAVINVILDERSFCLTYGFLNCMQLLSNVHALTTLFDHGDDAA